MDLFNSIAESITKAFPEIERADLAFAPTPRPDLGDVALRIFDAARRLQCPPPQLAARIAGEVLFGPEVVEASPAGPYVNFKLNRELYARRIVASVLDAGDSFGTNRTGAGQRVLIEHTSINPNASPHVGRARNALIGDSVVRLLRFEGYEVEVHYYVNDMGRQIGLLVLECPEPEQLSFDQVLDIYVKANQRAEAEPEFAAQGYELLVKMEEKDPDTVEKFHRITELCLRGQLAVLERIGARYDVFDRESDYLRDERLEQVLAALREKDAVFTDEDERVVVDLAKLGHERDEGRYFVLMRANGSSMYGCRDLSYTIHKMGLGADLNLIVLGEDHKLYAEQVALILGAAGFTAPEPIYYAYITLKEGKMSTRRGTVVLLSAFLDEAESRAAEKVEEQCRDLSPEERSAIIKQVALAAVRFAILRVNPNKNVVFEWESALSFTGDTGPYVQYSCARIASILRKFGDCPETVDETFPIDTAVEWALLMQLASFPSVVAGAVVQRNCAPIAQYALDTARAFTTFYHECPVIAAPTREQQVARAQLCRATRQTIQNALGLLGIAAPDRM
ncbi:MAG TPA: arginine--tRNA ligase [Candidatus Hydrogenedentes bacterium]|nr:arginine--tRNA ligase [Candidatus Hydrogenedentota bacterium]